MDNITLEKDFISILEAGEKLGIDPKIILEKGKKKELSIYSDFFHNRITFQFPDYYLETLKHCSAQEIADKYWKEEEIHPSFTTHYYFSGSSCFIHLKNFQPKCEEEKEQMLHFIEEKMDHNFLNNFHFDFLFFLDEEVLVYKISKEETEYISSGESYFDSWISCSNGVLNAAFNAKKNGIERGELIKFFRAYTRKLIIGKPKLTITENLIAETAHQNIIIPKKYLLKYLIDYKILKISGRTFQIKLEKNAAQNDLIIIRRKDDLIKKIPLNIVDGYMQIMPTFISDILHTGSADIYLFPMNKEDLSERPPFHFLLKEDRPTKITIENLCISQESYKKLKASKEGLVVDRTIPAVENTHTAKNAIDNESTQKKICEPKSHDTSRSINKKGIPTVTEIDNNLHLPQEIKTLIKSTSAKKRHILWFRMAIEYLIEDPHIKVTKMSKKVAAKYNEWEKKDGKTTFTASETIYDIFVRGSKSLREEILFNTDFHRVFNHHN